MLSGRELVKILQRAGWTVVRIRGSHAALTKPGEEHTIAVPLRAELKTGTLLGILRQAGLDRDDLERLH